MEDVYYIAYKDSKGNDCHGCPWLWNEYPIDKDFAIKIKNDLVRRGFKDVKVFKYTSKLPEVINWKFVENYLYE